MGQCAMHIYPTSYVRYHNPASPLPHGDSSLSCPIDYGAKQTVTPYKVR